MSSVLVAVGSALAVLLATQVGPPSRHLGHGETMRRGPRRPNRRPPTHCSPTSVAEWSDELARQLRSGSSLRHALSTTTPADEHLGSMTAAFRRALDDGDAVESAAEHLPSHDPGVRLVRIVLTVTARAGAASAGPLERIASAARHRADALAERRAHTAQARASAVTMTLLPCGVLAFLILSDADVRAVLTTTIGLSCVLVGGALNLAGWWWMRRLLNGPRWRVS